MWRFIYNFLFYLCLPFLFLRLLWRSRRMPAHKKFWSQRLGFCQKVDKSIWVHCASVGETIAAAPLIKKLLASYPTIPIVVSNMTVTGAAQTKTLFGDKVIQVIVPYDVPDASKRFLKRIHPIIAIFIETELWPNLLAGCAQKNIRVVLSNARLSEKSFRGYQRVQPLTSVMLKQISAISVQTPIEKQRFESLGFPSSNIHVTGNLKFDMDVSQQVMIDSEILRKQLGEDRLIWIAASTHRGEEEIILKVHAQILKTWPQALLIVVPRHPDRFQEVYHQIAQQSLKVARRSRNEEVTAHTSVYLADTMGELLLFYAVSDVAFIGGSLIPSGGHNMLEAAALKKPILTGPHLLNFLEVSEQLKLHGGLTIVSDAQTLYENLQKLFADANLRASTGKQAWQFLQQSKGSLNKQFAIIQNTLASAEIF